MATSNHTCTCRNGGCQSAGQAKTRSVDLAEPGSAGLAQPRSAGLAQPRSAGLLTGCSGGFQAATYPPAHTTPTRKTLVLGLGNVIMGDEGIGVHVARALEQQTLPAGVECLDGGTGGFVLLEPLQNADRIILIDACADGNPIGTVTRTTPRFARDYPPTLTAHDIGVKDLLDAFYMQSGAGEVTLYSITIDPQQPIRMTLSPDCARAAEEAQRRILAELQATTALSF